MSETKYSSPWRRNIFEAYGVAQEKTGVASSSSSFLFYIQAFREINGTQQRSIPSFTWFISTLIMLEINDQIKQHFEFRI